MAVLLDTNFILAPLRYSFNISEEFKRLGVSDFYILEDCLIELLKRDEKERVFAFKLLGTLEPKIILVKNKKNIKIFSYQQMDTLSLNVHKKAYCDRSILELINYRNFIVATLDKGLIKQIKLKNKQVITLHNNHLILI